MIEPIGIKIEVKGDAYWKNPREHAAKCLGESSMMHLVDGYNSRECFLRELPAMRRCGKTFWATYEALRLAFWGKDVCIITYDGGSIDPIMSQIKKHVDLGLQKLGVKIRRSIKCPDPMIEIEVPSNPRPGLILITTERRLDGFFHARGNFNIIDDRSDFGSDISSILKENRHRIDTYVEALDLLKRAIKES